ncbi:ABC transporter ATP-binding protein [Apilactobacillus micheneri]|uniref:ABC transporter ATP-binding protein n=1 Tax=Apilactobacillus micheneri TaxID=1899430 RepID=A0ABY2YVH7_9LACO|nr:ABC transporter ATP-binding protein [Apilactobacillus micheneri]TPR24294.1 ABC transporter ATP-binding protein [Apilactobacillus micheneri]TPR25313.1 ABC transporter ATP-binding protein [Apilactobacillus micheneri]TPR27625.1 ABC transporter ATP-binding protein [Apilactobacillus micheneri]TPR28890.1 ABC transporter ATP-binding protein [Apilactobacillus micheneri]TPR29912.1 ABC transporter ATP-binding protein [Apilactobacillus micheneri]
MIKLAKKYLVWSAVLAAVLFLVVQVSCDLYLPTVTSNLINNGVAKNNVPYIWSEGFKMLFVTFIGVVAAGGNIYFAATQSQKMGKKIRSAMYRKIMYLSDQDLDKFGDASLITRNTNDVVQIQNVMIQVLRMMIMSPIMLIGAMSLAFFKSPRLTIVFFAALVVLAIVVAIIMSFAGPMFKKLQGQTDKLNLVFREGLTGVRVIRAFNRDDYEQNRFDKYNTKYASTGIRVFMLVSLMFPLMTFILSGTNVGIVWFGAKMIANSGLDVGNLVAFMTYATQILISFMMLSFLFVFIPRAQASASRINEVFDVKNSINDPKHPDKIEKDNNTLSFDHVDFKYQDSKNLSLKDINFSAKAGQTVAVIGETGSGKSSLIDLIPRLYDVTSGAIKINGTNIQDISQKNLHALISLTQQKAVLFTGTVKENMQYGNENASDEEIWHALDLAKASDFIKEEGGLNAKVEQNGENFSGGQKQRLAIARTILKDAAIYIFDDSFSALDFKTDAELRQGLNKDEKIKHAITVIVAQRISTVADADLILVLNNGELVGAGTHKELSKDNPYYKVILDSQIKKGGSK